jgi:tetratricopeptide (TPR) repeat protein
MPLLPRILLILLVLATLASGLGYDPLALYILSGGTYALPMMLALILLLLLVRRVQQLEARTRLALERLEASREQERTTAVRYEAMATKATQLADEVQHIRQALTQNERLLPGRLMLLQRRFEEAAGMLQEVMAHHPEDGEVRWLLGEALCGMQRYAEALPHLHAGLAQETDHRLALAAQCEQTLGRFADAEAHLLRLLERQKEPRQEDLVTLGMVQSELDPQRAKKTLTQALDLNPYNSVARYQLIELEMRSGAYERAVALASEGLEKNPADVGCFVSRAEARFRRGQAEDETSILDDLATAQERNRKDYNIYRLRGALHQRRATQVRDLAESRRMLQQALDAYEDGLANVPAQFHAHLLAAESRVLLQLRRFDDAAARAQRAVNHHPGHVSNYLALAFARLATRQWKAAAQAADRGMQWAGWGGRVWLTAIGIFANAFIGVEATVLRQKCAALASDLKADTRRFALSDNWSVVRGVLLQEIAHTAANSRGTLVTDTIALLEQDLTPEEYQRRWVEVHDVYGCDAMPHEAGE